MVDPHTVPAEGGHPPAEPVWPLWEVFVRVPRSLSHVHAGSLHAPDDATAMRHARSLYAPPRDGVSVWVVPTHAITTSADATAATETPEVSPCR